MHIERTKEIFLELSKLVLDLPKDPASLGPDFLREQISICRNYLNQTSFYLQEVLQEHHLLAMNLEDKKAEYQIQSDELLANDIRVKNLPHIEDRQAMINVLLSSPHREIQTLEREITNLKHIEKVVRLRLKELDNTMSAIRLQRSLLRDQIRVGHGYGDETNTSRGNADEVDALEGDELARLIDESEAEVAGTSESVVQFGSDDSEEVVDSEDEEVVDLGEDEDEEPLQTAPSTAQKRESDPDQDLLDELDALMADGDDGETSLVTTEPQESEPKPESKLEVKKVPLEENDIDDDMRRFLEEEEDPLADLIGDI